MSKKKERGERQICRDCGAEIVERDIIGLNKKMLGRETGNYYCLECMAREFKVDAEFLLQKIDDWKWQGCTLFS